MFIGIKTDSAGIETAKIYYNSRDWFNDSFSPDYDYNMISFKITGKTYAERKESARALAIDFQNLFSSMVLYWGDLATVGGYLERVAKRYGLITEFKENGII